MNKAHSKRARPLAVIIALAFLAIATTQVPAADSSAATQPTSGSPVVAILDIRNTISDPRQDYLGSVLEGVVAFDLSSQGSITLVERKKLDKVLRENELVLTDIASSAKSAASAGKILGANYLVWGEYTFIGNEVAFTLSLVNAESGQVTVFRDRGSTENIAHSVCEQLVKKLTGRDVSFQDKGLKRSIISLKDETPGTIALYSRIINARITIDGEFAGYTKGDGKTAIEFTMIPPGQHTISTHLDNSFGVAVLPQYTFKDWDAVVNVEGGRRVAIEDKTDRLNIILYYASTVFDFSKTVAKGKLSTLSKVYTYSCVDRTGAKREGTLDLKANETAEGFTLDLVASFDGQKKTATLKYQLKQSSSSSTQEFDFGFYKIKVEGYKYNDDYRIDIEVNRTDLNDIEPYQGSEE